MEPPLLRRYLDEHGGSCPRCNYNLAGIAEDRCPECGHALSLELCSEGAMIPTRLVLFWLFLILVLITGSMLNDAWNAWRFGHRYVFSLSGRPTRTTSFLHWLVYQWEFPINLALLVNAAAAITAISTLAWLTFKPHTPRRSWNARVITHALLAVLAGELIAYIALH